MVNFTQISRKHDRKSFDCGEELLNNYLKTQARQADESSKSRTYVVTPPGSERVIAFYTLVPATLILPDNHPAIRKMGKDPGVYKLARLAVDKHWTGNGIGQATVADAVVRTALAIENAGGAGLVVDPKTRSLTHYYIGLGFSEIDHGVVWMSAQKCLGALEKAREMDASK